MGELFQTEAHIRGKPPDERRRQRQARAAPRLEALRQGYASVLPTRCAKADTTHAIQSSPNHRPALAYYCEEGRAEIDNPIAERALRGVAIRRRNSLFAGADPGGERAAAIYRLNGTNPAADLAYVLGRIANHTANRIDGMRPRNVARSLPDTAKIAPVRQPAITAASTTGTTVPFERSLLSGRRTEFHHRGRDSPDASGTKTSRPLLPLPRPLTPSPH
ncbi:hypothetical protein MB84_31475 (plasmid) [Pandoraea oxalativorans]|uniref:Transposase IS66 central domain-containing protein n=1 Tax=Pandoraea oxalativorans TaxID=573737 RepID=A0A192B181_9BURK|nr:hypothetical protein MB84_31475 [Pandoraea oxalativorans]